MKVCFVCSEYPPAPHGGIGNVVKMLAAGLANRGHEVRVVGTYADQQDPVGVEEDGSVRIWRLRAPRVPRGRRALGRLRMYSLVRRWAGSGEIDVVEAPEYGGEVAGWSSLPVPLLLRLHLSATVASVGLGRKVDRRMRRLERRGLDRRDGWCSVSAYLAERTSGVFGIDEVAPVIHNAVELRPLAPFEARVPNRVVFAGGTKPQKGLLQLLAAWPSVRARVPDAQLRVLGVRTTRGALAIPAEGRALMDLPGGAGVTFTGRIGRDELAEEFARAAAAVFPSLLEGFALAPLEAMATGCPTVGSRAGPGPESIDDGVDGLLADPTDPLDIADRITDLLTNTDRARALGEAGHRRIAGRFTVDRWVAENESFYEEHVRRAAGRT